jgi:hypothetical protein
LSAQQAPKQSHQAQDAVTRIPVQIFAESRQNNSSDKASQWDCGIDEPHDGTSLILIEAFRDHPVDQRDDAGPQ